MEFVVINFAVIKGLKTKLYSLTSFMLKTGVYDYVIQQIEWYLRIKDKDFGLFLLVNEKEIVSVAHYEGVKIVCLWTSPKHRGKGYATTLMKHITEYYEKFDVPHYISADPPVFNICRRIGWIQGDKITKEKAKELKCDEEEGLWFPPKYDGIVKSGFVLPYIIYNRFQPKPDGEIGNIKFKKFRWN